MGVPDGGDVVETLFLRCLAVSICNTWSQTTLIYSFPSPLRASRDGGGARRPGRLVLRGFLAALVVKRRGFLEPHGRGFVSRRPRVIHAPAAPEPGPGRAPRQHAPVRGAHGGGGAHVCSAARERKQRAGIAVRDERAGGDGDARGGVVGVVVRAKLLCFRAETAAGRHENPQRPRERRARVCVQLVRRVLPEAVHLSVAREHQGVVFRDGGSSYAPRVPQGAVPQRARHRHGEDADARRAVGALAPAVHVAAAVDEHSVLVLQRDVRRDETRRERANAPAQSR
mmetsp:Transcript_4800/g.19184  ORF Transcript_4800/g.19184 Transcript_4800/m.19184 type:complete len:284 (+) Transcript_4800:634-1485(+)